MRVIGLTGGIASGKSTVARVLEELGAPVIDADGLAREAVACGSPALAAIAEEFGPEVLAEDGSLDRKALGRIVFGDPEARKRLELITHPAIRSLALLRLEAARQTCAKVVFYMAPLLLEAGAVAHVDEVWVVYVDEATQMERLILRDGLSPEEARQRLDAQMPMKEKARRGKVVIDNRGSIQETERQIRTAWGKLLEAAGCAARKEPGKAE